MTESSMYLLLMATMQISTQFEMLLQTKKLILTSQINVFLSGELENTEHNEKKM